MLHRQRGLYSEWNPVAVMTNAGAGHGIKAVHSFTHARTEPRQQTQKREVEDVQAARLRLQFPTNASPGKPIKHDVCALPIDSHPVRLQIGAICTSGTLHVHFTDSDLAS